MAYIITNSKSRSRDFRKGVFMTPSQVKEHEKKKAGLEHALQMRTPEFSSNGRYYRKPPTDKAEVRKKLKGITRQLELSRPPKVTSIEKNRMWERAKQLVDTIKVGIPTKYEMHPLHLNPATGKLNRNATVQEHALRKHASWEKRNKGNIVELKNISRALGYPELGNVENYRPGRTTEAGANPGGARELLGGNNGK